MACNAPKSNWCRPISARDFTYASANHRPELQLGESVGQSAARIQMMSHRMSQPCEVLPYSSDFHDTLLVPTSFHSHCTLYILLMMITSYNFFHLLNFSISIESCAFSTLTNTDRQNFTVINGREGQTREVEEFLSWDSMMGLNFYKTADFVEEISPKVWGL